MNQNSLVKGQDNGIVYIDGMQHVYLPQEDIYLRLEPYIGTGEMVDSTQSIDFTPSYNSMREKQALINELLTSGPRRRTIKECLNEIKQLDSGTAITEFFIRQLCKQGKIDYYLSGNKSLVEANSLLNYLGYKVS